MGNELRLTLVADGSSDRALLPIIQWTVRQHSDAAMVIAWADLARMPTRPTALNARIAHAIDLYPCDLLFVHRDAERDPRSTRVAEITAACAGSGAGGVVPVVPVRMTEAWLLFDESVIRNAAGNPLGTVRLRLPRVKSLERVPDPKEILHQALLTASELGARRRDRFDVRWAANRVASLAEDFSPLRLLPSFRSFEFDTAAALARL